MSKKESKAHESGGEHDTRVILGRCHHRCHLSVCADMKAFLIMRDGTDTLNGSLMFVDKKLAQAYIERMDTEYGEIWVLYEIVVGLSCLEKKTHPKLAH